MSYEINILSRISTELATELGKQGSCEVNAVLIGSEINLKALHPGVISRKEPLFASLNEKSVTIIYPYGAMVFFNASIQARAELIAHCRQYATKLFTTPETEQFSILIQPQESEGITHKKLSIQKITKERLELIGDALAKSVILEYHENRIGALFTKIEPIAKNLKERGKLGYSVKDLLKHIGASLLMAQEVVGKIEVAEKPLLLWEHSELEPLHAQLVEDLEIIERQRSLERKLTLISSTAQTSLELLQQSHSHRLEWYIIALITLEVIIQLYDMLLKYVF